MTAYLFRFFCVICAVSLAASRAEAARTQPINTEDGSGIKIEVSCPFENASARGAIPLRVTVSNGSTRPGTWQFAAQSSAASTVVTSVAVTVEPGGSRSVPIVASMGNANMGGGVRVNVNGPGVLGGMTFLPHTRHGAGADTDFLAMSSGLGAHSWSPLIKHLENDKKRALEGTQFEPADLPNDWRAYTGLEWLALSDAEWDKLAPDVQSAIRQWVGFGGRLLLASQAPAAVNWGAFHVGTGVGPFAYGLGAVRAINWDGKEVKPDTFSWLICDGAEWKGQKWDGTKWHGSRWGEFNSGEATNWPMFSSLGNLQPNRFLILGFVILFGVLVGPVNLFWFAPAAKRHRMFWTTPALSVGGSALLIAVIFLGEGTGGTGHRFAVIHLFPQTHEAIVVQDQASRTALLFGSDFRLKEEALAIPVATGTVPGYRNPATFAVEGNQFSGAWFKSRSIQVQRLAAVRPTRAELTVVDQDASGAPIVVSSIESTLETVFVTGDHGKFWRGDQVRTGEKTTLRLMHRKEYAEFTKKAAAQARDSWRQFIGNAGMPASKDAFATPGFFMATVSQPKAEFIATLPSIRWGGRQNDCAIYVGPVTDRTASQTGGTQP